MASRRLSLTLVVDKGNNRVVWAESGGDFVDVLFSFLTLPLGTAVRVLGKQSGLGSVDQLYKSVEDLDVSCFQEACCKDMLLRPRSSSEHLCKDLLLKVDDHDYDTRTVYTCRDKSCIEEQPNRVYSAFWGFRCRCGGDMDGPIAWKGSSGEGGEVFVNGGGRFIITDDLCVSPVSASKITTLLLEKCVSKKGNTLEHRNVELTREQVLTLLQKSLSSKRPLTDMFLQKPECQQTEQPHPKTLQQRTTCGKSFMARLVMSRSRKKVLYAEVGQDVVDLVFSFLTIPLGSVIRLLEKASHIGCMDNLYKSVENLCAVRYCAKLVEHKDMLLAPKIAPHFGCSNQLLGVDESANISTTMNACACKRCAEIPAPHCIHGKETVRALEINPKLGKLVNGRTEKGGGFTKGRPGMFMMTDEMTVMLNSSVSAFQIMDGLELSAVDLEYSEVTLGEAQALELLRALLLSRTPFTDVFYPTIAEKNAAFMAQVIALAKLRKAASKRPRTTLAPVEISESPRSESVAQPLEKRPRSEEVPDEGHLQG